MTDTTFSHGLAASGENPLARVFSTVSAFFNSVLEGWRAGMMYRELAAKSDSELAAMGLTRSGIARFVIFDENGAAN